LGPWVKPQYADIAKHTTVKKIEKPKCFIMRIRPTENSFLIRTLK
jgi:hypothetical protein